MPPPQRRRTAPGRRTVPGAVGLVAGALERRTGVDQREVDVEEDGSGAGHQRRL